MSGAAASLRCGTCTAAGVLQLRPSALGSAVLGLLPAAAEEDGAVQPCGTLQETQTETWEVLSHRGGIGCMSSIKTSVDSGTETARVIGHVDRMSFESLALFVCSKTANLNNKMGA